VQTSPILPIRKPPPRGDYDIFLCVLFVCLSPMRTCRALVRLARQSNNADSR